MDNPIKVSFRWTADEMLLVQRLHMRYSKQGRKIRWIFLGAAAVFLLGGILGVAKGQDNFLRAAFPVIIIAGVYLAMPWFTRRAVLKMYSQKPDRDMIVTYEISPDRIATRSDIGSTDTLWRAIVRAQRTPQGFLLYPTDRSLHWLPASGFQDSADIERLAQIVKTNVKEYKSSV